MRTSSVAIQAMCLFVVLSVSGGVDSLVWPAQQVSDFKDYLIGQLRNKVLQKTAVMGLFNEAMARTSARYNQEKIALEARGETDTSALYYKIAIEEIRKLRESIEAERKTHAGETVMDTDTQDEFMSAAANFAAEVDKEGDSEMNDALDVDAEFEMDHDFDEQEGKELRNQLDELEREAEEEVGWGLTPEHQEALKERTRHVLTDLVQNELRQLALTVMAGYMTGSPSGHLLGPLFLKIKTKLSEFFIHTVTDVLTALLGHKSPIDPSASPSNSMESVANSSSSSSSSASTTEEVVSPMSAPEVMAMTR